MTFKPSIRSFFAKLMGPGRARILIKPDCDYVFVSGYGDEARGGYLRGKILLFVPEDEKVQGVQLKFTSRMWLGVRAEDEVKWQHHETTVFQWDTFTTTNQVRKPSNLGKQYEWPFELFIDGDQKETFKGCNRCSITYILEASTINYDTTESSYNFMPIRIIRSPAFSSYKLMDPATVQGKWAGKAEYNVSIRHRAIALGGLIPIDAQIAQLSPRAKVTKARFYLRERHAVEDKSSTNCVDYEGQRIVNEWPLDLDDTLLLHSWQQCLHLPRALRNCSPDFSLRGVTISHTLHFEVTINTNGTITEEEISMPIHLFISPELPVNGWGVFVKNNSIAAKEIKDVLAEGIRVPPSYCKGDFVMGDYGTPGTPPPAYSEV
ncbi:hypothetical protein QYS62_010824 [Fusarium acuminatum]|uniref:Arrestin C-terminal-like domain-containing protein n=1 Tax=Fusarium acuminatum TaxID=5515 RepID=A0ABZ2X932_9HYPO